MINRTLSFAANLVQLPYFVETSTKNPNGLLTGIEFLLFDIVLYSAILALANAGYANYWFNKLKIRIYSDDSFNDDTGDTDVRREYDKVQTYKNDVSSKPNLLVCNSNGGCMSS